MADDSSMLEILDAAIEQHSRWLMEAKRLQETQHECSGIGAMREYQGQNVVIQAVNDRRIIELQIAPAAAPSEFRAVSAFMDWLEPAKQGRWNLGIGGEFHFLERNWERVNQLLREENWQATLTELDAVARRFTSGQ